MSDSMLTFLLNSSNSDFLVQLTFENTCRFYRFLKLPFCLSALRDFLLYRNRCILLTFLVFILRP